MKNSQKGFIVPVLVAIIALLVIGGGIYIYKNKKVETPVVNTGTQQTNTQTLSVATNQTILNSLVTDWKKVGPGILPGFPAVSQAFYGYPDIIQFIGNNRVVISYQDDFNPLYAVLSYDTNQKQFSYLDGLRSSPFKVTDTLWNTWRNKYGNVSFAPQTYQFSSTRTGDVVYSSDWKLITKNPFISTNSSSQTNTSFQTGSISSAYVYGPELNKVKVFLYASDEKKTITAPTDISCANPSGSEVSRGNYKLIVDSTTATSDNPGGNSDLTWKNSTLDIGLMEFVKGTSWDGKITADIFDPIGYKNFIVLQKYGSCNGTFMQVYGYDLSQGKLVQYKFVKKDNSSSNDIFITNYKKSSSGNLVTSAYDNTVGKTIDTEWVFDSSKNTFIAK